MNQTPHLPNVRVPQQIIDDLRAIAARKHFDFATVIREAFAMYIDDFRAGLLDGESLALPVATDNLPTAEQLVEYNTKLDTVFSCITDDLRVACSGYGFHAKTAWRLFVGSVAGNDPSKRTVEQWETLFATIVAAKTNEQLARLAVVTAARTAA